MFVASSLCSIIRHLGWVTCLCLWALAITPSVHAVPYANPPANQQKPIFIPKPKLPKVPILALHGKSSVPVDFVTVIRDDLFMGSSWGTAISDAYYFLTPLAEKCLNPQEPAMGFAVQGDAKQLSFWQRNFRYYSYQGGYVFAAGEGSPEPTLTFVHGADELRLDPETRTLHISDDAQAQFLKQGFRSPLIATINDYLQSIHPHRRLLERAKWGMQSLLAFLDNLHYLVIFIVLCVLVGFWPPWQFKRVLVPAGCVAILVALLSLMNTTPQREQDWNTPFTSVPHWRQAVFNLEQDQSKAWAGRFPLSTEWVAHMREVIANGTPVERMYAIHLVGLWRAHVLRPDVTARLTEDDSINVRYRAAQTLGLLRRHDDRQALAKQLQVETHWYTKIYIWNAISKFRVPYAAVAK